MSSALFEREQAWLGLRLKTREYNNQFAFLKKKSSGILNAYRIEKIGVI